MKINQLQKNIPTDWQQIRLDAIGIFSKGAGISKSEVLEQGYNAVRYGELYTKHNIKIEKISSFIDESSTKNSVKIKKGDILFAGSGETAEEIGKSAVYLENEDVYAGGDIIIFSPKNASSIFLAHLLNIGQARKNISKLGQGQSVVHIYKKDLKSLKIPLPPLPEQHRIVAVLETWDNAIELLKKKIALKKQVKKGLMQKLLSGDMRLPGFSGEWKNQELGELLNYEQPTKYLVSSTDYSNVHDTPVLTAGKTFLLGYTDENEGIFNDLPVIIFDDFTTANKFVTFPFKVKSSAMKMLSSKNKDVNLKFIFERMQFIHFPVGEHKRQYLSEYQYIPIKIPNIKEQNATAEFSENADREITLLEQKLHTLELQKKFLLNNLLTGEIRTPENLLAHA